MPDPSHNDKEHLLSSDTESQSDFQDDELVYETIGRSNKQRRWRWCVVGLSIALSASLAFNFLAAIERNQPQTPSTKMTPAQQFAEQRSPYTDLPYNIGIEYSHHTPYTDFSNETAASELWDSISIDPLVIAVTPEWAEEKGLPPSWTFPWDTSKRYYFIKMFHQLHCLKLLHRSLTDFEQGSPQRKGITHGHLMHCVDSLRQDVMCKADDTPMPSLKLRNGLGDGQIMQCKDFGQLLAWIRAPGRDACYRQIDDYSGIEHGIERFAFCDEGSEYYPAMKAYFDEHGHLDPFE